jgi:TrmH family RNA methyltransferase
MASSPTRSEDSGSDRRISHATRRLFERAADRRERRELGLILLEGERVVALAHRLGLDLDPIVVAEDRSDLIAAYPHAIAASAAELKRLGSTATPAPVLALCPAPVRATELDPGRDVVVLDGVQDPGNVGAILRIAEAYGLGGAVLGSGCADPTSPKVVRGSMGAVLALPVIQVEALAEWLSARSRAGARILLAEPEGGRPIDAFDLSGGAPVSLVLGSEARGASSAVKALTAAERVTLPAAGVAGSLGVTAAAAILIHLLSAARGDVSAR